MKKEDIKILFCAPNKAAAINFSKRFPEPTLIGPHPSNKRKHFYFNSTIHSANLKNLKATFSELVVEEINIIMFHVNSENRNYYPDQQHHCESCQAHHRKK